MQCWSLTHISTTVGLIPRFVREGFEGRIIATAPTVDLLEIMLEDALKIQLEDVKYKKRRPEKERRTTRYPIQPLFEEPDVRKGTQPPRTGQHQPARRSHARYFGYLSPRRAHLGLRHVRG